MVRHDWAQSIDITTKALLSSVRRNYKKGETIGDKKLIEYFHLSVDLDSFGQPLQCPVLNVDIITKVLCFLE